MTNDDLVFIVVSMSADLSNLLSIESVWTTKQLAKAAVLYHSQDIGYPTSQFKIIERKVNTAKLTK